MNLTEIEKILNDAGVHTCSVCGTPFTPFRKNQCTCGSPECMAEHHRRYVVEYNRRKRDENPEAYRRYRARKMREYRARQKELDKREEQFDELAERWQKQSSLDRKIVEYGLEYGKRSAEKVLAAVPKIDVNMGESNDRVQNNDE